MSEEAIDDKAAKPTRAELLEEEGEIAADYLEELMDIADIDGDIDIDVADGRAQLSIVCEDEDDSNLRTLVGRDGKTLGALQEL
ncbi:single-stranded DNA-binding protein, partial [Mycobacterium tuberculosis]|nr:single-stranded DNA-binding protein [Mycobacterium tuberculosis]